MSHPKSISELQTESRRAQDWSASDKLAVVLESASVPSEELGAYMRQRGLYREQLEEWKQQALEGLRGRSPASSGRPGDRKRMRELEKELKRKDKALAETAALLVLKKKAQMIWGDEEDDTDPRSDI